MLINREKRIVALIRENRKLLYLLPNIFTALNMACGFSSILFAYGGKYYLAALFLIIGSLFDLVDGRVARLTGTESPFGEQFDSMSDVISFGIAPAFLVYTRFLAGTGRIGLLASFAFLLCGALRLARFNANIKRVHPNFFQGLPIPMAALAQVGYTLFSLEYTILLNYKYITMAYLLLYSLMMISNIPFLSFKHSPWMKRHKKVLLIVIFFIIGITFIHEELMILIVINAYLFSSLIYYLLHRKEFADVFDWEEEDETEEEEMVE